MAAIMFSHEAFPAYRLVLASQKRFIFLLGEALKNAVAALVEK